MSRRFFLALFLLLAPLYVAAEERRAAIVVLDEPALVEKLIRARPNQKLRREHLQTREADDELMQMRGRKAALKALMRRTGVEFTGDTEVVLNAVMVRATAAELEAVRAVPGVQSADFAREYELLMDGAIPLVQAMQTWALPAIGGEDNAGRGIKIAIVDSGIDHTHPMLQDGSLQAPSGFPKGDRAFTSGKVIAAQNFTSESNSSDRRGHGTFVASVAAGRRINGEVPNGPTLSLSGIAPKAYLGNYKVFTASGSTTEDTVIRAINTAVIDGMDIINLSLGLSNPVEPSIDRSAPAVRNAISAGVLVVAAVGNTGPGVRTIGSPATLPNVLAVGATTNGRAFFGVAQLAGTGLPAELREISALPGNEPDQQSVFGPGRLADISRFDDTRLGCPPGSDGTSPVTLPSGSLSGKVAFMRRGQCFFRDKVRNAFNAGATGVVIYNHLQDAAPLFMDTAGSQIPSMSIGNREGEAIERLLRSGAAIDFSFNPRISARPDTPDIVAGFSSRGPVPGNDMKIKPDVMAPGQYIAAAVQRTNPQGELFEPTGYSLQRGTSFSAPIVAGAAALLKQARPSLTPDQLKSLLVNTADPITRTEDGAVANVQNTGSGRVNILSAMNGSLVADPVSLSFGARSPSGRFSETQFVKITNLGNATDTLTLSAVQRTPLGNFTAAVQPSTVTLAPGASTQVSVTLSNNGIVQAVADGMVNVRSGNTGRSINVPYWVTFLVPELNSSGIVNAASFQGGAAPGSIVSIFGVSMASQQKTATSVPLETELGGTKVELNNRNLPLFFTSASQLNVQIPYDAPFGSVGSLRVSVDGLTGGNISLQISQFAPGLFTQSSDGRGIGAMLHADNTLITAGSPARPGETIVLYGTGLGPVDNAPALGRAAAADPLSFTTTAPVVFVAGNREARVQFSGLAPGFVGLYQVNVTLPGDLPPGDHPLVLTIGGVSSNTVTVPVR